MADKEKYCEHCKEEEQGYGDNLCALVLLCILFGMPFHSTDHKLREEVAELRGKVSVLEKLAAADRRG